MKSLCITPEQFKGVDPKAVNFPKGIRFGQRRKGVKTGDLQNEVSIQLKTFMVGI